MLAASFSSAGSAFAGAGAAVADEGCERSTRILAFAARNAANSFDAAVSCSVSFVISADAAPAAAAPPALALAFAARASRSARHVLLGASGSAAGFVANSFARSLLTGGATAERGASVSADAAAVVAVADAVDSLLSVLAGVTQPVEASSSTAEKIARGVREVMRATEQQHPLHGKPYLAAAPAPPCVHLTQLHRTAISAISLSTISRVSCLLLA